MKIKLKKPERVRKNLVDFKKGFSDDAVRLDRLENFKISGNTLLPSGEISELKLPLTFAENSQESTITYNNQTAIKEIFLMKNYNVREEVRSDKIIMINADGTINSVLIFFPYNTAVSVYSDTDLTEIPEIFQMSYQGYDTAFFSYPTMGAYSFNQNTLFSEIENSDYLSSFAKAKNILVGIIGDEKDTIRYTYGTMADLLQNTAGRSFEIKLDDNRDRINKIFYYENEVFVFQDYSISKIANYTRFGEYNVFRIFSDGTKIYSETICQSMDGIYFYTKNGFYRCNGSDCKKVEFPLENKILHSQNMIGCIRNGKYYLACKIEDGSQNNFVNNSLIIYDINDKSFEVYSGVDICDLKVMQCDAFDKVVFARREENYNSKLWEYKENSHTANTKVILIKGENVGYPDKLKQLHSVYFNTLSDVVLEITAGTKTYTFSVSGKGETHRITTDIKAKKFDIKITTTGTYPISDFMIEAGLYDYDI